MAIAVALFACLAFFGARDGLAADSDEWIAMHAYFNVKDEIPEVSCDVEFNPEWVTPRPIPVAPFLYHFSDICYNFRRSPTQSKEPYDTLGEKLFKAYAALGVQERIRTNGKHTVWEFQCTTEFRKLVTAHAWLSVNGNIFDSSTTGADFIRLDEPPKPVQDKFQLLVDQAFYTLKIESDSLFVHEDVVKHLSTSTFTGQTHPFTPLDLNIINSFARGVRMGLLTLHTINVSEWNMVHLANIHRAVCFHVPTPARGFIRTSGLMITGSESVPLRAWKCLI